MSLAEPTTAAECIQRARDAYRRRMQALKPSPNLSPPQATFSKQEPFEMVIEVTMHEPQKAKKVLFNPEQIPIKWPSIRRIVAEVSRYYSVAPIDIISKRRTAAIVKPRQIVCWLAKKTTMCSLPEIGRQLGGRDHTTILHACRKIERLSTEDKAFGAELSKLEMELNGDAQL